MIFIPDFFGLFRRCMVGFSAIINIYAKYCILEAFNFNLINYYYLYICFQKFIHWGTNTESFAEEVRYCA